MNQASTYLERHGEIGVVVLNRPAKLNALNEEVWSGIARHATDVAGDPELKVMILRGVDERAFSAGADIAEFPKVHATAETAKAYHDTIHEAYEAVATMEKPTIALVRGICFGGGCALALCCDLRYADTTSRFCIPPAKLGIAYSFEETKRLHDLVGPAKTKEMLLGAKVIDAEEALAVGLATRIFGPEEVEAETFAFAEQLCRLSQFSIRTINEVVKSITAGADESTAELNAMIMSGFEGEDYHEGRDAFLTKRKANFTYR